MVPFSFANSARRLPAPAVIEARLWGDRAVAGGHLIIILALGLTYLASPPPADRLLEYVDAVWAALGIFTCLWVYRASRALKSPLGPWTAAVLTIAEFAVLYAMILGFQVRYGHEHELLLKSPSLQYAYLFLAFQIFRFDKRQVLVAGASAVGGYLTLVSLILLRTGPDAITRDYVSYLEGPYVLMGVVVEHGLILGFVTLGLYVAVHRGTTLIKGQVQARHAADEALDTSRKARLALQDEVLAREAANLALEHLAHFDVLTTLPNRQKFEQLAEQAAQAPGNAGFAVLQFDIDRFRSFNDGFGREAGNALILGIAARLGTVVPSDCHFGRVGADEFALLMPCLNCGSEAVALAQACQQALAAPIDANGISFTASLCVGVALSQPGDGGAAVTTFADIALNAAKAKGPGSLFVHSPEQRHEIVARLSMETDLRLAADNDELELFYQPIRALDDERELVGWEALARWKRRGENYVSPGVFIPLAEETGLISPIGAWALVQAARDARRFIAAGAPAGAFMSVNVSPRQLEDSPLLKTAVERALEIHPHIKLELTESAVVEDSERGLALLNAFASMGAQLSLDDFGTGTSSLATLGQYPFSTLKIDRSFVVAKERNAVPMLHAIVGMAQALGLETVAEGVETPEEIALMQSIGATYGQGYGLGRPQSSQSILDGLAMTFEAHARPRKLASA